MKQRVRSAGKARELAEDHGRGNAAEAEEFMAVAAHDLRNPIAVVRASAQMAQRHLRRADPDAAQVRLAAIVQQTDRLTEMIETFLDASRISAGRLPLQSEASVDLRHVIDGAIDRARLLLPDFAQREVAIEMNRPCTGAWDRIRLMRAIHALLANALIYGDTSTTVQVDVQVAGDAVYVRVTGHGPGPDAGEVEHLFEQFYRGKSSADAGQAGSGLGLFVARGIAQRHGGDVRRVEGDIFELELPLALPT
jgi:signal transduction histidine kinase